MGRYTIFFLLFFFPAITHAQFTVAGKVIDSRSKEPLNGASVFCENTTIGTFTDQQGNFSLGLSPGGYTLIISYTGYKIQKFQVTSGLANMDIRMVREDTKLKEIVIKARSTLVENGWDNYGKFFTDNFIGTTPNAAYCFLLNPEVLKFHYYKDLNKIKVFATAPLKVKNESLGYLLTYELDSFVYYFDDAIFSYRGTCLYTEMQGSEKEKKRWARNRSLAYEGSVLHFMRSYYNGTLKQAKWEISLEEKDNAKLFYVVSNPYDTSVYISSKEKEGKVVIRYPRRIKIMYAKMPEPEYLEKYGLSVKKTRNQFSAVDMIENITIKENGYYYDPFSWVSYNYWSWKNMADQLPYDYFPQK